jgi:prolyl oligopeptidase
MKIALMFLVSTLAAESGVLAVDWPKVFYPETRLEDVVDDYHGTKVSDPFRWLEDDNAPETKAWVQAENKATTGVLETIPQREKIRERLTKLWNYERFGVPWKRGGRYFYSYNSGLQNQSAFYVADTLDAKPRLLLDPNTLSTDGTTSLTELEVSEDGKLLVYGLSKAGSDWQEFHLRDIDSGQDREDVIHWVKFSGASWKKDGSGFFYARYDEPKTGDTLKGKNEFQKLYFHKLGTPQSADGLVYERKDHGDWGFGASVSDDGRYLLIHVSQGTDPKNRLFYQDLQEPTAKVVELLNDFDAEYDFIDNDGPVFYFRTDLAAPRYRVVAIDTRHPERAAWKEIIPQTTDLLESANSVGDSLICRYLKDARSEVVIHGIRGFALGAGVRPIALPGLGTASGFGGRWTDNETFYSFTGYTAPAAIYRLDMSTGASAIWKRPQVDFDSAAYDTKQVFFPSKDGTKVPMFITHKRGLKLDGTAPTLLYGYGGFNISMTPSFAVSRAVWLEMGGVYAVANLRGGGEYGGPWHQAGTKLHKQNVFDDFIGAAEFLIAQKYTSSAKLAINGGSNGGLLIGACMTQRPDLYAAAIPAVGVMDMLRFHKFTIGWAWKSDYGSSEDPSEFQALYAYSPYHNLKPSTRYPATMVMTADHDDRVVPAHSFKFAARLQQCQAAGGPPVLIRIETSAGHGAGTALKKLIEESTDLLAFLVKALGMEG